VPVADGGSLFSISTLNSELPSITKPDELSSFKSATSEESAKTKPERSGTVLTSCGPVQLLRNSSTVDRLKLPSTISRNHLLLSVVIRIMVGWLSNHYAVTRK
jgi:hypothetical protein